MIDPMLNQPAPVDTATEQWFDSIKGPAPEPPKSSRKKHMLIGAGILVLLALAGTATAFILNQGPACLDTSDYQALTGTDATDTLPATSSFYTNYVLFEANSNTYDDLANSGEHGKQLIQKVADFYKTAEGKSVLITVSGNYFSVDAKNLVESHIGSVKSSLLNAGVPENVITTKSAAYVEPEDPSTTGGETIITVNSASTCK